MFLFMTSFELLLTHRDGLLGSAEPGLDDV